MVGLPLSASATVGRPSTGATASPVALASGVRTPFTSITNSSVSFFFTVGVLSRLASPSLGAMATSTRLPTFSPVSPATSCLAVFLLSSTSDAGVRAVRGLDLLAGAAVDEHVVERDRLALGERRRPCPR